MIKLLKKLLLLSVFPQNCVESDYCYQFFFKNINCEELLFNNVGKSAWKKASKNATKEFISSFYC
jgi:hypothetical protein